ncbi:hypothetical protein MMAN_21860 [Mycobacterium mantenii]|uniref:Uncharacterized protein n=1 Tax=Mycobacterium mantenii TaxID=560555 RepID=A0A1X0FM48_MYCNT|nr:MmpS family transport accessory protein [Mycobacterium mantenii]MCV7246540.1 hypothetical protein [Mycobacterium mantenii]ORB02823.1 hypothetical protein BST30_19110 [Mycobacterium mantenii]BBY38052.1 hypothetical protein MMAN_21860 [Mycobacterium mantenii]
MIRICFVILSLIPAISAGVLAPRAQAADSVTYEVVSNDVATANVEYFDLSQRKVLDGVQLPWRTNVTVIDAHSPSTDGAEVRADWRSSIAALPVWRPGKWVTVRIYFQGKVICQNTLDVGNAACYGSTTFKN